MQADETAGLVDFAQRLRRSKGRSGRSIVVSAKVTQAERAECDVEARKQGKALSEWSRDVLLREARRSEGDPLFTEIIAMRMYLNLVLKHISCGELLTAERYTALLSEVRSTKHKQASDVLQQYMPAQQKESSK